MGIFSWLFGSKDEEEVLEDSVPGFNNAPEALKRLLREGEISKSEFSFYNAPFISDSAMYADLLKRRLIRKDDPDYLAFLRSESEESEESPQEEAEEEQTPLSPTWESPTWESPSWPDPFEKEENKEEEAEIEEPEIEEPTRGRGYAEEE